MRPVRILAICAVAAVLAVVLHELLIRTRRPDWANGGTTATTARVAANTGPPSGDVPLGTAELRAAVATLKQRYDRTNGGFGSREKLPQPMHLDFLMRWFRRTADGSVRDMALHTLDAMSRGGIHDQVGGGFHRASTDSHWIVPQFEKTLYDNCLLTLVYLDALAFGPNDDFTEVLNHTLAWIRSMAAPTGGFYGKMGAEGAKAYYTWPFTELRQVIDEWTWPQFVAYFPVTEAGDVDGVNVLHAPRRMADVAAKIGRDVPSMWIAVRAQLSRLRTIRAQRSAPAIDKYVVVAWNGLAISALARSAQGFGGAIHGREAARAATWILGTLHRDGKLSRWEHEGTVGGEAMLEDYAFLIAGLLDLFEATHDVQWLRHALILQAEQDERFHDDDAGGGGYFRTPDDSQQPPGREKPWRDFAEPSGNAVAAHNLLRLAELTGDGAHRDRAVGTMRALAMPAGTESSPEEGPEAPSLTVTPEEAPAMLAAAEFLLDRPKQIVIVVPPEGDPRQLLKQVHAAFLPNRVLVVVTEGESQDQLAELVPLVADKEAKDGVATAYVCAAGVCQPAITDPAALSRELARVTPLP